MGRSETEEEMRGLDRVGGDIGPCVVPRLVEAITYLP